MTRSGSLIRRVADYLHFRMRHDPGISEVVKAKLASVDWGFSEDSARQSIHTIHPYPAKFIPQIPRELIRLFHPGDSSVVADIFCGSGTALVESIAAGLPAIGVDLNPLAILIAKVKTTPLTRLIHPIAKEIGVQARSSDVQIPAIPRLDHWFRSPAQRALANLIAGIRQIKDISAQDALRVAISRIIVRVSNQESDTRYAAIEKQPLTFDQILDLFVASAELIDRALSEAYGGMFSSSARCKLLHRNVLDVVPEEFGRDIGLLVGSPPYPNAYEYWLYHKYRMYWLGMDPIAVRTNEIGARPHYFKKNRYTEVNFEEQMSRCFWLLSKVMRPGSFTCLIVGRSIIHGHHIDNVALLGRAALPHGFQLVGQVSRKILRTRKAFNPANSKINDESIVIFHLGEAS
jgi:hypothetical protein